MKNVSKLIGITALVFAGQAHAQHDNAPSYFTISSIVHAGSGCPAGSVAKNIAPDKQAFTLLFDSFYAEVGPGVSIREKRKNCTVNLAFDYPAGWQFALINLQTRGYVSLDQNVNGLQQTSFYFQGDAQTGRFISNYNGAVDRDYVNVDTIPFSNALWSPCASKRSLNINSEVRIDNSRSRSGQGLLTIDSIDGYVTHLYGVSWRRC
jgi:hypothetical protein